MKSKERKTARILRKSGYSLGAISNKINCSKSTVSRWVKDISLTISQVKQLKNNQDLGRAKAANHPNSPKSKWFKIRNDLIQNAAEEIPRKCSLEILKIIGTSLYWAEGTKSNLNIVNFSNSDPSMIYLMMIFFRKVCKVPEEKFRGAVHIHPHLNRRKAVKFWSKVSGIPLKQFHKVQISVSSASKNKKDTLPLGTFRIVISDTRLQAQIQGWIKGIKRCFDIRALGAVGWRV